VFKHAYANFKRTTKALKRLSEALEGARKCSKDSETLWSGQGALKHSEEPKRLGNAWKHSETLRNLESEAEPKRRRRSFSMYFKEKRARKIIRIFGKRQHILARDNNYAYKGKPVIGILHECKNSTQNKKNLSKHKQAPNIR
jgi:hypothetical protein